MKYVIIFIYVMYFIVYGYSCHMTSTEPENTYWGYICTFIFGFLFTWSISMYTKNQNSNKDNKDNS